MSAAGSHAVLIRASAGTGKTFALATHVLRLVMLGEPPDSVLALTFSRAAAAEISSRVALRLAEAGTGPAAAAAEAARLAEDDGSAPAAAFRAKFAAAPPAVEEFRAALRTFVWRQHRSMMTTIDAFMARMLQAFPAESGLQRPFRAMEDDAAAIQRDAVVEEIMGDEDPGAYERCSTILRSVSGGRAARSLSRDVSARIEAWHEELLDRMHGGGPGETWGDPAATWGAAEPERAASVSRSAEELEAESSARLAKFVRLAAPAFEDAGLGAALDLFAEEVRRRGAAVAGDPAATASKRFLAPAFATGPGEEAVVSCGRKKAEKIVLAGPAADALRDLARTLLDRTLRVSCERAAGLYALALAFENRYRTEVRARGRIVFSDVPRLLRALPPGALAALQWRFDSRIRHVALDEFQDTSPGQWDVLRPFADEIKQADDGRTLFVVGDGKQAIYGWRGGDSRLFAAEAADGVYLRRSLVESRRFPPEIAEFVNRVFDPEALSATFSAESGAAPAAIAACAGWSGIWEKQRSLGKPAGKDAVRVLRIRAADGGEDDGGGLHAAAAAAVAADLAANPLPAGCKDGVAVLVPENKDGEKIAAALSGAGVAAVWEGASAISDTPVAAALLSALVVAEHPDPASAAWGHVRATGLPELLASGREGGAPAAGPPPSVAETARLVSSEVARKGLPAALRAWCSLALAKAGAGASDGLRERLDSLVAAASDYVRDETRDGTLAGFAAFARARHERAFADPTVVKIVTSHRSKGLTFDRTYVPLFPSHNGFGVPAVSAAGVADPAVPSRWILPWVSGMDRDPVLLSARTAANAAKALENLCTAYVSLTRARSSLVVLLPPESSGRTVRFTDHVSRIAVSVFGSVPPAPEFLPAAAEPPAGGAATGATAACAAAESGSAARPPAFSRLRRRAPSRETRVGHAASDLFAEIPRRTAAERGSGLHAALAALEWLPAAPGAQPPGIDKGEVDLASPSPLRDALVRPDGVVDLWRERAFETMDGDEWTTGAFDRVVFRKAADGSVSAEIFDFKTNRMRSGETAAGFERRMVRTYSGQMEAYRRALARLVPDLRESSVGTTLLLTATRSAVRARPGFC